MWELPLIAAKGRWRILLIVNLGSSSQMTKVIREWAHNCAKNLNYCKSWASISEGSLFWDVNCCKEIKGVNCYVSHYLKNFLAFLKSRRGEISLPVLLPPPTWMSSSVHEKTSCDTSGLFENKTSWWPLKIPASVLFLFGTLSKELYVHCKSHNHSIDLEGRQRCLRSLNHTACCVK